MGRAGTGFVCLFGEMGPGPIHGGDCGWWVCPPPPARAAPECREAAPLIRPVERADRDDPLALPYWQYEERQNRRYGGIPPLRAPSEAAAPAARGGGSEEGGVSLGLPALGDIPAPSGDELTRRIELAYRQTVTLPNGSALDIMA